MNSKLDFVCVREYDRTLVSVAAAIDGGDDWRCLPGLAVNHAGEVIVNAPAKQIQDLDALPFVSDVYRRHLNYKQYFYAITRHPVVTIISGRGCPYKCNFCMFPQTLHGHQYRRRSPANVAEEIQFIEQTFPDAREIFIEDDTLTVNKARVRELCEELLARKTRIKWTCNSRCDVDEETLRVMRKAGCRLVCVGVESGVQEILDNIEKGIRLEVYGREFFRNDYARVAQAHEQDPSWSQILEGHGVSWILIDQSDLATRPLVQALYRRQEAQGPDRRDWGLVWFDDNALIFFRRDAFEEATWDSLALGFRADLAWMGEISAALLRVNPQWLDRLVALVEANPGNRLAVDLLLAAEQKLETFERRAFALEHLLTFGLTDEERARAEHALGMVHFRRGEQERALARLEAARALSPDSLPIALDRAGVLWTLRREEETVAAYRAVLEIDPSNAQALEALLEFEAGRLWRDHPSGATPPAAPEAPAAQGEDSEVVS